MQLECYPRECGCQYEYRLRHGGAYRDEDDDRERNAEIKKFQAKWKNQDYVQGLIRSIYEREEAELKSSLSSKYGVFGEGTGE